MQVIDYKYSKYVLKKNKRNTIRNIQYLLTFNVCFNLSWM